MELRGKRVLITGAASGIGLATAREFAQRRAVPILVDINAEGLAAEMEDLKRIGYESHGYTLDITDFDATLALRDELESRGLSPDVLVNVAGLTLVCHVGQTTHSDFKRIIDVNLMGTINIIMAFLPAMMERGYGHITNVSSIDGIIPVPGQTAYCASKFAITGFTEVLYFDLRQSGIGVTLMCPGYVNTPMAQAKPIRDLQLEFKGSGMAMNLLATFSNSPKRIARHIVLAVVEDKFLVIPGAPSRLFYHYRRLFPKIATKSGVWTARAYDYLRRRFD